MKKPRTLSIDIGGSRVKWATLDANGHLASEPSHLETPAPATRARTLRALENGVRDLHFERIACGFPGVVVDNVVRTAVNLHPTWVGKNLAHDLEARFGRPARVSNDAGMQGYALIRGEGVEIAITLGTGMGFALFHEGRYVPNIELAHHPFRRGQTYEQWVGQKALARVGEHVWRERVGEVVQQVRATFSCDRVFLGGGNSRILPVRFVRTLGPGVSKAENVAGVLGGIALWAPRTRFG